MSTNHRLRRSAARCALVCAVLVPATGGAAFAASDNLPQEEYYSSHAAPGESAALAQEQYFASYGNPDPLASPAPAPPSDGTPWLPIALSVAGSVVLAGASATQVRRMRVRRSGAAV